jgi:DNA-binding transcriptional MerR regulator
MLHPALAVKSASAFKTISEVSVETGVPQHVLRFWEAKFPELKPMKRGGGRRYYRPEDVSLLMRIQRLLHEEGYTIKGVQKVLREQMAVATPAPIVKPAPEMFVRTRKAMADGVATPLESRADALRRIISELKLFRDSLEET